MSWQVAWLGDSGSRERIDEIVALIMALERATMDEAIVGPLFFWRPEDGVTV